MPDQNDIHAPHQHPTHLYQDWGLLTVITVATAMIMVIKVLQLPMPFLTLPSLF